VSQSNNHEFKTLNVKGMMRNRHLALSVADAGMSRLVTLCTYKAERRGRTIVRIDRWFPGSQTSCVCGQRHPEMRKLLVDTLMCNCGNRMGRDRNAAINHYMYPEERGNRSSDAPTRVEIGDQEHAPVPIVEARRLHAVA